MAIFKRKKKEKIITDIVDFEDHDVIMKELQKSQDAEVDNRHAVREAHLFLDKRDGQWQPFWWDGADDKPKYTFDLTTNVVNQISAKLKKADFSGKIKPAGGEATKEIALTFDGLIRNIQSMSQANNIFNAAGKSMVTGGLDGWEVVQKFVDDDSFDQDLMIGSVENFVDRVWFNVGSEKQDRSDSTFAWKFTAFTPEAYKKKWPKGSAMSLDQNKISNAYFHKANVIMVGQFYYIKEVMRELVQMDNGAVYEVNDDFKKIQDELKAAGIVEINRRERPKRVVWTRKMDANGWLNDAEEMVFQFIPLIPTYGNFKIAEEKTIYYGAVEKRIDPQRTFNFTMSRELEEAALAPRAKYFLTEKQMSGHQDTFATLNTNTDPVQAYTPDPDATNPITQEGGAQINPALRTLSQATSELITATAGFFDPNLGDNPKGMSGVAIEKLQPRGDAGSIDYFESQEIAICHTMRILIKAIPRVYIGERQIRLLKEDDSFEMVTLNEKIMDEETREEVVINDLSIGTYDVTCKAGVSFQNRQDETVAAIIELATVNPQLIELGSDIILNNVSVPGMNLLADRVRAQLFSAGAIPEDQWTDEEKEFVQMQQQLAQQQQQQPTPEEMIGQAELMKAADDQLETQVSIQEKQAKIQLAARKEDREDFKAGQSQQQNVFAQMLQMMKEERERSAAIVEELSQQAATLKVIREAFGVDTIVGPHMLEDFVKQAILVSQSQNEQQ